MKKMVAFIAFCFGLSAGLDVACTPAKSAEDLYAAQQLACVAEAGSRVESQACRERVRAEWGVDAGGAK